MTRRRAGYHTMPVRPSTQLFNTDAQSWMNLQTHYDTEMAREKIGEDTLSAIRQRAIAA